MYLCVINQRTEARTLIDKRDDAGARLAVMRFTMMSAPSCFPDRFKCAVDLVDLVFQQSGGNLGNRMSEKNRVDGRSI